ncbi:hypothetical protein YQE_09334, partial [Dendroctonus ponderosae]
MRTRAVSNRTHICLSALVLETVLDQDLRF